MPRLTREVPRYRKHRASGQAIVTLSGQDVYLGPHGTKVSRLEYDRQVAEWLARGRRPLDANDGEAATITVVELIAAYKRFAESYYRKNGKVTNEVAAILSAAKIVKGLYARDPANAFGPLKLQAVQQAMILAGWSRKHINKQIGRVVRMFGWGVSQELVSADVAHALREVKGLHKGRTQARETSPVMPVDESVVNATLEHLPAVVADMVRLQRLTGCRPGEVCLLRPCDLDRTSEVWAYRPESHKTEHHGRDRVIFIGPQAQDVLRPYLLRNASSYCFSPQESERKRHARQREARQTAVQPSQQNRRTKQPKRSPRESYDKDGYGRAIARACRKAGVDPWAPNRLRHSAATEIRRRFGLEAAQVTLGHSKADTTQIYAERDYTRAIDVMAKIG
jgi:integrase